MTSKLTSNFALCAMVLNKLRNVKFQKIREDQRPNVVTKSRMLEALRKWKQLFPFWQISPTMLTVVNCIFLTAIMYMYKKLIRHPGHT